MESEDVSTATPLSVGERVGSTPSRRGRRLAPAVTPVRTTDLAAGAVGQLTGRGRDAFRRQLVSFLDADSAGTYTSVRHALYNCLLTLAAADDSGATEVLIPAFCSADFPVAIEAAGLQARRYDIDPETLAADIDSVAALPTENALALIAVNVAGYSSAMDELAAHCKRADLRLIEALGYALGASYRGRRLGRFGDCSVLNFQQGKPVPVGGGMVVSQTPSLSFTDEGRPSVAPNAGSLVGYAAFGRPRLYAGYRATSDWLATHGRPTGRHSTNPESDLDDEQLLFATMSDFQGRIASRVFNRRARHQRHRAAAAADYRDGLADCAHLRVLRPVGGLTNHQHVRFPVAIDTPDRRRSVADALSAIGVETTALYDWPPIDGDRFSGAHRLQAEILTLPTHPYVDSVDRQRVIRTVRAVLDTGDTDGHPVAATVAHD